MKFLGIDGGGTSTNFLIIDQEGKILSYVGKPTCHYLNTSLEVFKSTMAEGINEACRKINISPADLTYSFVGIPGYGEIKKDMEILDSIIGNILQGENYKCGNDSVVAWAGSLACQPGINIVAGTGAIGFGLDSQGQEARASGWGEFCGDEGSAYWLGQRLINYFAKQADGRMEKSPLYQIVREEVDIKEDFQLLDYVINEIELKRDKIAGLARLVYRAAQAGDKNAIELYSQAAYEHYLTISSIINQLDFQDRILISYSGGVFRAEDYILGPLKVNLEQIPQETELIRPILGPLTGAALYALKLELGEIDKSIVERLKSQEKSIL